MSISYSTLEQRSKLAGKIIEVQLLQKNISRIQTNVESRKTDSLTYSFLIGRCRMLREYYEMANTLYTEIIATVPRNERPTLDYFSNSVFATVTNTFDIVDALLATLRKKEIRPPIYSHIK